MECSLRSVKLERWLLRPDKRNSTACRWARGEFAPHLNLFLSLAYPASASILSGSELAIARELPCPKFFLSPTDTGDNIFDSVSRRGQNLNCQGKCDECRSVVLNDIFSHYLTMFRRIEGDCSSC